MLKAKSGGLGNSSLEDRIEVCMLMLLHRFPLRTAHICEIKTTLFFVLFLMPYMSTQVWLCVWGHACDLDGGSFCFVYDEVEVRVAAASPCCSIAAMAHFPPLPN